MLPGMTARLYGIPASHPVYAATLMLDRKGVAYSRVDLPQWFHRPLLRVLRFPATTVPALVLDGRRVQTTKAIARALDGMRPDPPLVPADPDHRAQVETIETWCDGDFQQMGRRLVYWALARHGDAVASYLEGSKLILPMPLVTPLAPVIIKILARDYGSRDEAIRQDLASLPGLLDRIDAWIADGALGGEEPNVADYQVATSLALLMSHDDLRPLIAARPAGRLASRLAPDYPGRMPPAFPREWLPAS
ncbi:MAG TPA: glutathione S-transferase family protein [Solirubrobacteraceae bacterium]|nr:glutathione S-transferase family protein [Solirubrobacteraceae bacterium]